MRVKSLLERDMGRFGALIVFVLVVMLFSCRLCAAEDDRHVFSGLESKKQFALEVSSLIEKAWKEWQDSVLINDIDVDGSRGLLSAGDITGPVLTVSGIMSRFDGNGKSRDYVDSVRAVAGAVADGMRSWQRGYTHDNIPFPRGSTCAFTLPPCNNVPVTVGSGRSSGEGAMKENSLYSYMLYRAPEEEDEDMLAVFRASAKAVSGCFAEWKRSCFIAGVLASGGIAPHPAPIGSGPGPVKGAKGRDGKLTGAYFDGSLMYRKMVEYFESRSVTHEKVGA